MVHLTFQPDAIERLDTSGLASELALAEERLARQTEGPARAELLSLISRYKLNLGDVSGAVNTSEQALRVLSPGDSPELKAQCYVNVGEALLLSHKPRRAARLMLHYLRGRNISSPGVLDGRILLIAGETLLQLRHPAMAERMLNRAEPLLRQGARSEHVDRHFRARIQVRYTQGAVTEVHKVLQAWEEELHGRPKRDAGRAYFWYDKALFQVRTGSPSKAIRCALNALEQADEHTTLHFDCYLLLSRTADSLQEGYEALAFALTARSWAIDHRQWDLERVASSAMTELLGKYGEPLISGLQDLYTVHGIDISQFIPKDAQRGD